MSGARATAAALGGLLIATVLGATTTAAGPEAGDLDKTFGKRGKVTTGLPSRVFAADAARAPNGGAYVAANTGPAGVNLQGGRLVVLRYDRRGRLTRNFGKRGIATLSLPQGPATVGGMAVQPDGRLVLVGSIGGMHQDLLVVRLTRSGKLDGSFADSGVQTADFGSSYEGGADVAVQPDGSVVVAGSTGTTFPASGPVGEGFVARYRSNGSVDTQFGGGGTVILRGPAGGYFDAQALALLGDGSILVGGNSGVVSGDSNLAAVALLRSNGTPDPRLGPAGITYPGLGNGILRDLVLDRRSGRVYLAGSALSQRGGGVRFFLMALEPDLSRDESFGKFGAVESVMSGGAQGLANSAVVDGRGRILLGGTAFVSTSPRPRGSFALARFLPTGKLDKAFGHRGWVHTFFGKGWNVARALLLQSRRRLLAVGNNASAETTETGPAVTLARYRLGR
ncbi:MAG: hypothetical protein QOD71_756 [Thermoleophilaceae bacterium]|jgi:uncharacterized delta-60 repeat protein|nr:hypothetical protein [Thermoleophilaceae bacterium]